MRSFESNLTKNVLEFGSGAGGNYPFFKANKIEYFGIEQSPAAVNQTIKRFPELKNSIYCSDFAVKLFDNSSFTAILDRASITHNSTETIAEIMGNIYNLLIPGGIFIGVDWFSMNHSDLKIESIEIDEKTRTNFESGQFVGVGTVHFTDLAELYLLAEKFEILEISEKIVTTFNGVVSKSKRASFNMVLRKPVKA